MADPPAEADTGTGTVEASDDTTAAADTPAADTAVAAPCEPAETAVTAAKTEADAAAALLKKRLRMVSSLRIVHSSASAPVPVPSYGRLRGEKNSATCVRA